MNIDDVKKLLTPEQGAELDIACTKYAPDAAGATTADEWLYGAFDWMQAPQGYTYWREIFQQLQMHGTTLPDPDDAAPAHSPEPWRAGDIYGTIEYGDHGEVTGNFVSLSDADRARVIACVNACEGIATEVLECEGLPGLGEVAARKLVEQRDMLLAALMHAVQAIEGGAVGEANGKRTYTQRFGQAMVDHLRAAIAAAGGAA